MIEKVCFLLTQCLFLCYIIESTIQVLFLEELSTKEAKFDPYRQYPAVEARVCRESRQIIEIHSQDILEAFASSPPYQIPAIGPGSYRIVLSLNRVSPLESYGSLNPINT